MDRATSFGTVGWINCSVSRARNYLNFLNEEAVRGNMQREGQIELNALDSPMAAQPLRFEWNRDAVKPPPPWKASRSSRASLPRFERGAK